LQRRAYHLSGVNDPSRNQVFKFAGSSVVAGVEICSRTFSTMIEPSTPASAICRKGASRRPQYQPNLSSLSRLFFNLVDFLGQVNQRGAARNNAFFYSSFGSVESVFNPQFAVFEFGAAPTLITATPPRVWRSALEVFLVVVRVGIFQLATDLTNSLLHVSFGFTSGNDRGGFFVNRDLTSDSHHIEETASRLSDFGN